jgi:transcriptional regulator NrdR family protein
MMNCPNCHSENTRRSRRRGLREGMALRLKHQAPYRCTECGLRFIASDEATAADHHWVSIADYLGLIGKQRLAFSDHVILGGLTSLLLGLSIVLFFAVAFGWIEPSFLQRNAP